MVMLLIVAGDHKSRKDLFDLDGLGGMEEERYQQLSACPAGGQSRRALLC